MCSYHSLRKTSSGWWRLLHILSFRSFIEWKFFCFSLLTASIVTPPTQCRDEKEHFHLHFFGKNHDWRHQTFVYCAIQTKKNAFKTKRFWNDAFQWTTIHFSYYFFYFFFILKRENERKRGMKTTFALSALLFSALNWQRELFIGSSLWNQTNKRRESNFFLSNDGCLKHYHCVHNFCTTENSSKLNSVALRFHFFARISLFSGMTRTKFW